jgi:hypothetical protein
MSRIQPVDRQQPPASIAQAFREHVATYGGRITNMKATLGHSALAFSVYMQWYPLYEQVKGILGERLAYLFAFSVSEGSNCPLCTTFFRRIIIDHGERPEALELTDWERTVLDFGSEMARQQGRLPEALYAAVAGRFTDEQVVVLVAFAGQMIATNVFNNALEVEIDESQAPYLPLTPATPHEN